MAHVWRNWARDQHCAPAAIDEPCSEQEVVEALTRAAASGLRVRVAGAGHSFTDIACTDGVMLRLGRLGSVIDADPDTGLATVGAGISLHELGPALAERGLAMENLGDVDKQSLGGALATGTHGTGARFANLSSQVARLRLVTAAGEVVECSADEDPDLFRAARVGLGAVGVLTAVTLRCLPAHTLRRVDELRPLGETLDRLEEHAERHEHFEFFAFPYTDIALTRTTERTEAEPAPPPPLRAWLQDVLIENGVLDLFCRAGKIAPGLVPRINRALTGLVTGGERTDRSYAIFANPRLVRFTEMEYAIPRVALAEAVRRVFELVERRRLPVGFPIEVRIVAPDDAFLSPAAGRDTGYVAVHMYRGTEFESYFRGVEAIMRECEGRPHWGKRHYRTAADLAPLYPDWDRFQAVRARVDPHGLFRNDYTDRVLGPVSP
ncbi:MAG: D-arabinono-1,4-lactone oxidase [Thermoleophilaceae bacterium]